MVYQGNAICIMYLDQIYNHLCNEVETISVLIGESLNGLVKFHQNLENIAMISAKVVEFNSTNTTITSSETNRGSH